MAEFRKAVYAGSFDPPTNGHLEMIEKGAGLFDNLVLAIGINPDKRYTFSSDERMEMLKRITRDFSNISIDSLGNQFLVNYAESIGARYILRGIRSGADYEYERGMRYINSDLNPKIESVLLMPLRQNAEISSSFVKGLIGVEGWEDVVERYIPKPVYKKILEKFNGYHNELAALLSFINAEGDQKEFYDRLLESYSKPYRAYHNIVHIVHSLREFEQVRDRADNPKAIEMAIWFHDAIYDTHSTDNEEKSAELAKEKLTQARLPQSFIDRVYQLILVTKYQKIPTEKDFQLLADIDFSVLGRSSHEESEEVGKNIREEYGWVPEDIFRERRVAFLEKLLEREHIYLTDYFRGKYEGEARANIKDEISRWRKH